MTEHLDVVIVGAGISGVSAAWHLQDRCPTKSYTILERRDDLGGTWDLFKYPGIRSDSDMFTLGFRFKPWRSAKSIADGADIKKYIKEAAVENQIDRHIRYRHRVVAADWSDADNRWTLTVENDGQQYEITCSFLFACTGYYNYDEGYSPTFPGSEDHEGAIVHPQHWPEDLDYAGKKIVVIGSGATAITLIPALVNAGSGHVTMLQRSPTYIGSLPGVDPFAVRANRMLPDHLAHMANRWKAIAFSTLQYQLSRKAPAYMRKTLMTMAERRLPKGYDVEKHFGPRYNVWDQRLCLAPDGDFFRSIRHGKADVVTDTIEGFTERGIRLKSGRELEADIIVTATGLKLLLLGGIKVAVDSKPVTFADTMNYKGVMFSDVPNLFAAFGYTNASWTLKCDLTCAYVARLINHMDRHGYDTCTPRRNDPSVVPEPLFDFSSGYIRRAIDQFPRQGSKKPWRLYQNYVRDLVSLRFGAVNDPALDFARRRDTAKAA